MIIIEESGNIMQPHIRGLLNCHVEFDLRTRQLIKLVRVKRYTVDDD